MSKVIWTEDCNFVYQFDLKEPIYDTDYFKFYDSAIQDIETNEDIRIKQDAIIVMISEDELMIKGPFCESQYVFINNIKYIFQQDNDEEKPDIEDPPIGPEVSPYELIVEDGNLFISKLKNEEDKVKAIVEIYEYTNEVYPDYPFRKKKINLEMTGKKDSFLLKEEKNVIYEIKLKVNNEVFNFKHTADILCYFSTISSLKEFIEQINLNIILGTDDSIRKLIQEKSTQLKRKFGLTIDQTENPEYFPAFKTIVNLYCVQSLMSISFINGNFISTGENDIGASLRLGQFSTGDDGGSNGYILSTDLINGLIVKAESELYTSIYKPARRVKVDRGYHD